MGGRSVTIPDRLGPVTDLQSCTLRQNNGNRSDQESKFDFGANCVKIENHPTDNQIYEVSANQFSPSAGTTLPLCPILNVMFDVEQK